MIKILNVSKEYKSKNKSFFGLKDINLFIEENEIVGVIGYSGAGKSTLIRILNGLIKPDIGTVYIDNIDINKINSKDLNKFRNKIGMVFQSFNLLSSLTVYQNVELALIIAKYSKNQVHARVNEVLKLVGIFDQKDKYPKQLSGGQKQRVAIARAIANNPKYLLCDEITSALDISTSLEIISILKKIKEESNISIIFISHQINVVTKLCQRVVVMEKGQIIEDLPTIDLFIKPKEKTTKKLISELNKDVIHFEDDVYKLIYLNNDIYENTLLSDMAQKYKTKFSILSASTVELVNKNIGILTVKLFGTLVDESVSFLKEKGLYVEKIIKKEGIYNE